MMLAAVLVAVAAVMVPSIGWAAVAANTSIINQASLTFDDGSGPQTITSGVTVTVALVPGVAGLTAPADDSTPYAGVDTPLAFTYQVTANGNGPDTYTVSGAVSGSTNTTAPSVTTPAQITLGATITVSGSTTAVLQVPSDGTADATPSVNGIEVGNTVVIGGEVRQVTAVSDPATGTATITLDTALSSAPAAGEPVFERQDITVTVNSGTIIAAGTDITVTADITLTNAAGSNSASVTATFTSGTTSFEKYVRNVSWAAGNTGGGGATSFNTNGTSYNYYTSGVTGRPGDVMEYVLVASNTSGSDVTGCTITDVLPTAFVAFVSDVWAGTADVLYVDQTGTQNELDAAADGDEATLVGDTLTVNVGTGAGAAIGGTIPAGIVVRVTYQVMINP